MNSTRPDAGGRSVHNAEIAVLLNRLADLLEIEDANPFRVRAYRNAAHVVDSLPREAAEMLAAGENLSELPGIGKDLAGKIAGLTENGRLPLLEEVEQRTPASLAPCCRSPGSGPSGCTRSTSSSASAPSRICATLWTAASWRACPASAN